MITAKLHSLPAISICALHEYIEINTQAKDQHAAKAVWLTATDI